MAAYAYFKDFITGDADVIYMPDDSYWERDSVVCRCGEDSGWRHFTPYDYDPQADCDNCGEPVRNADGSPTNSAVPAPDRPATSSAQA